jgi:hypothetical protein
VVSRKSAVGAKVMTPHERSYRSEAGNALSDDDAIQLDRVRRAHVVLRAFRANGAAFQPFYISKNPAMLTDPATPERLDDLHGYVDLRAQAFDWPNLRMADRPQLALEPAAIRAWLAPADEPHRHLSPIKQIYDRATLLRPRLLGTTRWHVWAFGTWRQPKGYFETAPKPAATSVPTRSGSRWHERPQHPPLLGPHLRLQALTINGEGHSPCRKVTIAN